MPEQVELLETWVKDITRIHYSELTPSEIEEDVTTVDGKEYQLPKTHLIWIKLWTSTINGGHEWATMRRWTPDKARYYQSLVGQQVKIEIVENGFDL